MTLRPLITVFLVFTLSSCRIVATGSGQEGGKIVNVREFGARGNGLADDTGAIQSAINTAKAGETIYFPSGVYIVSNFAVKNRSGLSFVGEGQKSVIKQKTGASRIATVETSSDILISNLAFDANGIVSYGGVGFYAVSGVRIENNKFIDSAPKPIGRTDRYSFVFARGSMPSRDIKILNNVIEDLQLEVDHSKGVVIEGNTVSRAVNTAGIGIFSVGHNAIAEDYLIKGNTVIDPPGAGFSVGIDPPSDNSCIFRRITIVNNRVIRTKRGGYGVRIGTPDNSKSTTGNVFEDIVIEDNLFRVEATASQPSAMIFTNTSDKAGIVFDRLIVTGNTVENDGPTNKGFAIDLRRIRNSRVTDNTVKGVANGISLSKGLLSNEIRNNTVSASVTAYSLEGSRGGNRAVNNRIVGNSKQKWKLSNIKPSDSIAE
jgi:parallel beta-helix repeat protein